MDAPSHWAGTEPVRILEADGTTVGDPDVGLEPERLRALLRHMVRARRLDRECMALQRQGELTVYPPFEGQEAAQVGSAFALGNRHYVRLAVISVLLSLITWYGFFLGLDVKLPAGPLDGIL